MIVTEHQVNDSQPSGSAQAQPRRGLLTPLAWLAGTAGAVILLLAIGLRLLAGQPVSVYVPAVMTIAIVGTAIAVLGVQRMVDTWPRPAGAAPAGPSTSGASGVSFTESPS